MNYDLIVVVVIDMSANGASAAELFMGNAQLEA